MNLEDKIENIKIAEDEIGIFWLGQAGFLIKDGFGRKLVVDPYLTDCGYRMKGFKRLSPKLLAPESLSVDYYITTHIHFDHFDFDAIPIVAKKSNAKFYGPVTCYNEMIEMGIDSSRVNLLEEGIAIEPNILSLPRRRGTLSEVFTPLSRFRAKNWSAHEQQ